jgi:hypothetical protein
MADKLFRDYFNEKTESVTLPDNSKILIQEGTDEPKKIDIDLFATADNSVKKTGETTQSIEGEIIVNQQKISSDHINNLFLGRNAGAANTPLSATEGRQNTFLGSQSGLKNTTGYAILNVGFAAGSDNTIGNGNCNVGYQAGASNESGNFNTNLGTDAGARNKGDNNMFLGWHSGFGFYSFLTGDNNNILGYETGGNMLTAFGNNGLGRRVFFNLTNGYNNVAMGDLSSFNLQTGLSNVTIGRDSGFSMVTSVSNVIVGQRAGYNVTGNFNTLLGDIAGFMLTIATSNTFIGSSTGNNPLQKIDVINSIAIGRAAFTTKNNQAVIGASSITETLLRGNVAINKTDPTERLDVLGNGKFSGTVSCGQFTTATEPAYVKGAQFFNTTLDKMRIGGATAYETVTSS